MIHESGTVSSRLSRRAVAGLLLAGALAAVAGSAAAATLEEIKKRGYMVVATEDDYRPWEYVDNGKPLGLNHALLDLLKKEVKFEIRQQIIPWTGLLAGVSTGKYDVAVTAAVITAERTKSLDFTQPVGEATHYYVARKGDDSIKGIKDLTGKTIGVQAGGASFQALPDLEEMLKVSGGKLGKVVQYTSFPEAYQDLLNGRIDYVSNGIINLISLTKEQGDKFKLGERVMKPAYAAWAVAKGNAELLALLDGFITQQRKSGEMYKLQEKWLGRSFPDAPTTPTK